MRITYLKSILYNKNLHLNQKDWQSGDEKNSTSLYEVAQFFQLQDQSYGDKLLDLVKQLN